MPNRPPIFRPQGQRPPQQDDRPTAAHRGYDRRWRHARLAFLREHPTCEQCERENIVTAATVVDHVIPHRGDPQLFWDVGNWQALCKPCHDSKTGKGQ